MDITYRCLLGSGSWGDGDRSSDNRSSSNRSCSNGSGGHGSIGRRGLLDGEGWGSCGGCFSTSWLSVGREWNWSLANLLCHFLVLRLLAVRQVYVRRCNSLGLAMAVGGRISKGQDFVRVVSLHLYQVP